MVGGQDPTDRSADRRVSVYHLYIHSMRWRGTESRPCHFLPPRLDRVAGANNAICPRSSLGTRSLWCSLMKRCHRQMQRFAIYGRVKAFVHRKELSAWMEGFMLEIHSAYKSFSVSLSRCWAWCRAGAAARCQRWRGLMVYRQTSEHEDLEEAEWVPAYAQAKEGDKRAAWEVR